MSTCKKTWLEHTKSYYCKECKAQRFEFFKLKKIIFFHLNDLHSINQNFFDDDFVASYSFENKTNWLKRANFHNSLFCSCTIHVNGVTYFHIIEKTAINSCCEVLICLCYFLNTVDDLSKVLFHWIFLSSADAYDLPFGILWITMSCVGIL